jgi:hypothetical protein
LGANHSKLSLVLRVWMNLSDRKTCGLVQNDHDFVMFACNSNSRICAISLIQEYFQHDAKFSTGRIFQVFVGSVLSMLLGKNRVRAVPKFIAKFLNLQNPDTGDTLANVSDAQRNQFD